MRCRGQSGRVSERSDNVQKKVLRRALTKVTVLAGVAGALMIAAPAHADDITSGAGGVLSGNQVNAPINAPINVCSLSIPIFGVGVSGCEGGATGILVH